MIKYKAMIEVSGQLEPFEFETNENPIEHIWQYYGMSIYIQDLREIQESAAEPPLEEQEDTDK